MVGKIISVILTGLVVGSSVAVLVQIFLYSINFLSNIFRTDFTDLVNQQHFSINELVIKIIFFFLIVPFFVGLLVGIIRNNFNKEEINKINSLHESFINTKINLSTNDKVESIFHQYKSILNEKLGHIQK